MFIYRVKKLIRGRQLMYVTLVYSFAIFLSGFLCDYLGCVCVFLLSLLFIIGILIFKKRMSVVIVLLIVYCIGSLAYSSTRHITETKFEQLLGVYRTYEAKIVSVPVIKGDLTQFEIEIECGRARMVLWQAEKVYHIGDVIEVKGQITSGRGARNPGSFDYRKKMLVSGISGELFVKEYAVRVIGTYPLNPLIQMGMYMKNGIVSTINANLSSENAALLNSMLIGYTEDVDEETKKNFNASGLTHLMAVSGMNVTFVLLPVLFIAKKLGMKRRRSGIIGMVTLLVFIFITGFAASIVRASIMGAMILLAKMIDKDSDFSTSIALAALVMELFNPMIVFDLGFQFSFCATMGIVMMSKNIATKFISIKLPKFVSEVLAVTIAAQLAVIPIMINYFNQISIVSILANLLVVPITGTITVLGFVLVGLSPIGFLARPIALIEEGFLTFMKWTAEICANIPYAVVKVPDFGIFIGVIYYLLIWFLFYHKKIVTPKGAQKVIAGILCICLILWGTMFFEKKKLEVTVLDVGQGDSILITTPLGRQILIDSGDGKTILSNVLLGIGVSKIDLLILTHSHLDHVGGYEELKKWIPIDKIFVPSNRTEDVFAKIGGQPVEYGNTLNVEDLLELSFLNPQPLNELSSDDTTANDESVVTLLSYGAFDMLMTGDIGNKTEEELMANQLPQNIEVLKVGHHGSNESSSEKFLSYNGFQNGIISVGKNLYGHPNSNMLERLRASGCTLYRTDIGGAVSISTDGTSYSIASILDAPACGGLFYEYGRPKKTYSTR